MTPAETTERIEKINAILAKCDQFDSLRQSWGVPDKGKSFRMAQHFFFMAILESLDTDPIVHFSLLRHGSVREAAMETKAALEKDLAKQTQPA